MIGHWLSKFILHKVLGWKIVGEIPDLKKMIIPVAPHTSWQDFHIGILTRGVLQISINYVGKKELFDSPFGWLFRYLGGAPVDRHNKSDMVQQIIDIFDSRDEFRLALAPEGTRKQVKRLRTGFYYVAKGANIPIVPVGFDFPTKSIVILPTFKPTDNEEEDFKFLWKGYSQFTGKNPQYSVRGEWQSKLDTK